MTRLRPILNLATAALVAASPLAAQQSSVFDTIHTPHGTCRVWIGIPGGSTYETERSYAPCAVDQPARLLSDASLPQPLISTSVGGQFTVVVRADGTVEPRLTRAWSISMDSVAYRRILEALGEWRFQPAMKDGQAVRSGFILQVRTDLRTDTLPSELRWRYRQDPQREDSLVGRWVALKDPRGTLSWEQHDSLYAALFRRLVHMRVLAPWLDRPYCIVLGAGDDDPARHARLSQALRRVFLDVPGIARDSYVGGLHDQGGQVLARGCEREAGALRLFLPGEHPTEGTRVVTYPAGDYLADWPPGFRGSTYPGWSSRCVVDVPVSSSPRVHCEIRPRYSYRSHARHWERDPPPRWYRSGDSVHVTVVARMRDAFQTDTFRTVVTDLRRFRESAVLDADSACAWSWNAYTTQDSGTLYLVKGDLEDRGGLSVTRILHRPPPPRPRNARCAGQRHDSLLAAFFLGDLGDRATAPVTFCIGDPLCTRQYEVDPERHTMAARAAVRFRIANLREATRVGDQLDFRIFVEPVPEELMPLILVRHGSRPPVSLWPARRVELGAWDFNVTYDPSIPADSEISIYLVAR